MIEKSGANIRGQKNAQELGGCQKGQTLGKIGIVTLVGGYNYGNRLQNYAVQQIYETIGFSAESLVLDDYRFLRRSRKAVKEFLRKPALIPESTMSKERLGAFGKFNGHLPTRTIHGMTGSWKKGYSFFSTGSDQVWNPHFAGHRIGWYMLKFAPPHRRIALAPSIGLDSLTPKQARLIAWGVAGFSRLSVREKCGAELIKECSCRDAEVICDPTLVLSSEEWRAVADDRLLPTEPFVFAYLLGDMGAEARDVLEKVTDFGRIPVIQLSDRQKSGELPAGPAEFISLVDNAAHVVTDSFHGAVFSSILQTPLTITHREGGESMFSRLEQLSRMLGIEEKIYGSPSFDLSRAGDYEGVPEAIERERQKFMTYLEGCLNGKPNIEFD